MIVCDILRANSRSARIRASHFALILAWFCVHTACATAQDPAQPTPQPSETVRPAGQSGGAPGSSGPGRSSSTRPDGQPADGKPAEGKEGEAKAGEPADGSAVIDRPMEPTAPPDPTELEVRPDDDGKLAFSFRNQPWVSLLEWFAEIADQPLDWRQLPGDHVNLASSGRYTLEEVFDLLNRHLLARGFTMVQLEDGLMVLKTEGINPALVPRAGAEQLQSLQPHQFVRASMDAGWLSAEELAEELKPMISSNGRLVAMKSTNRIEAMDAATNLLQIFELLQQELSAEARDHLAPEFELRYISADDAKKMLEQFLGIEEKEPAPLTPQQQQRMQQMQQQARNSGQEPPTQEKKAEISIVANPRRNSVLIQAPADRLAIAREFIKRIDVPSDSIVSLADVESRVEAFRLVSLDPEKLIEIVQDMNILEPTTRIRVDSDSSAVIVSGGAADRFIIKSLIERLDGSGREFYVLPVRYRDPRAIAESITFLMGKDKQEDESSNRRPYYSYFGSSSQQEESKPEDEFRVTADVQFRQVLVWANELELAEVRSLLVKLGELPPEEGSRRAVRVLDVSPTPETYEYLQRLKEQFQQIAPNEVELPPLDLFKDPNQPPPSKDASPGSPADEGSNSDDQEEAGDDADGEKRLPRLSEDPLARRPARRGSFFTAAMQTESTPPSHDSEQAVGQESRVDPSEIDPNTIRSAEDFDRLFGNQDEADRSGDEQSSDPSSASGDPAPLQFSVDRDGRIVVRSKDTAALDRLEDLMMQLTPPKRPYRVFYIKHASAYWVQLNLEDYFSEEDEEEDDSRGRYYFYDYQQEDDTDAAMGLDQQKKMRMVSDPDTNTIVVTGATPEQLRTIEELIELWDVPEPLDKRKARYTKLVQVKYSRAEKIADTVKEAYRDLLSSNDKAFSQGNRGGGGGGGQNGQRNQAERSRDGGGSELVDQGRDGQSGGSNFEFKGKLAIGVDDIGNSLLVTAEGEELLKLVVGMIEQLDTAAQPQGDIQVHKVAGSINVSTLEAALRVLSSETAPATPQTSAPSPEPSRRGRAESGLGERGNGDD